ncbi:MAG: hypothetical protein GYA43_07230, partial [Bacteroidales bacterium]|nr:hypothetical protein [Bacteroidales bacterium]
MKKLYLSILILPLTLILFPQNTIFSHITDIGYPEIKGSSVYNDAEQSWLLKGSGYNIWFGRDEFHYAYEKIKGDFILTAEFQFNGKGKNAHRKTGWMVRADESDNAPHISAVLHGDGLTVLQWRLMKGAFMRDPEDEIFAPKAAYSILRLEREGNRFTMLAAHPGEPLQVIGTKIMENMPLEVLAGLFVCSHDSSALEEVKVWNVRIDKPVPDNYQAVKEGYPGSRLEIMNVFDGRRKIVWEKQGRLEAPNWMPDGKRILFNMDGFLWTIPSGGGEPEKLNTGFADNNNNDHGISFDGKLLAISHHRPDMPGGGSTVYVLPLTGGTPQMVTEKTPSYWHGWAPGNKEVLYVAMREGSSTYNIYRKPVKGGEEVALTATKPGEHVDGCEYSPDGNYIYYNGSASGTMQIWRMKPDGSRKEQITFDEYNDWFPHISPDGKWIIFLSYPVDIPPNSHPSYKKVMLRIM